MIDHERAMDLSAIAMDFQLSQGESRALDEHLAACASCRRGAAALRSDQAMFARLPESDASVRARHAVVQHALYARVRPGWGWIGGAAAAAAIIVVATATGLSGSLVRTLPSTLAERPLAQLSWTRISDETLNTAVGEVEISAVARSGSRIVAVGSDRSGAAAWISDDGRTWARAKAIEGSAAARMLGATATSSGRTLVAVGLEVSGGGGTKSVAWTSLDGNVWTRASGGVAFDRSAMRAVTAGGPGLVAVGQTTSPEGAAVWTSADGRSWSRVPDMTGFQGARMTGVATGGPGLVAVGYDASGAAVWISSSGSAWQRVANTQGLADGRMLAIGASRSKLVAVGLAATNDGEPSGVVWTSTDGLTWSRAENESSFGGSSLTAVSVTGNRVVVAGQDRAGAAIWTSEDGAAWTRVATRSDFLGAEIRGVLLEKGRVLAVGTVAGRGAVWSADNSS